MVTALESFGIKDAKATPVLLRAGVCWHGTPTCALISRDAADTRFSAVWQLSTSRLIIDARCLRSTHLFATCTHLLTREYLHVHVRVSSWTWMTIVSHETPTTAVWAGAHVPCCQMIPILWPHPYVRRHQCMCGWLQSATGWHH